MRTTHSHTQAFHRKNTNTQFLDGRLHYLILLPRAVLALAVASSTFLLVALLDSNVMFLYPDYVKYVVCDYVGINTRLPGVTDYTNSRSKISVDQPISKNGIVTMQITTLLSLALLVLAAGEAKKCTWYGTAPDCDADEESCSKNGLHYWADGTMGEGKYCVNGRKVLCCDVPSPYVYTYWEGTAPFCSASCEDCLEEKDECIIECNKAGDGNPCHSGCKTLCGSRDAPTKQDLKEYIEENVERHQDEATAVSAARIARVYEVGELLVEKDYDKDDEKDDDDDDNDDVPESEEDDDDDDTPRKSEL